MSAAALSAEAQRGWCCGFLLARAGIEVVVLEKHADFLRDFRGDTIHPSTLELMYELGILEEFLRRPHQELRQIGAQIDDFRLTVADFSHLPTHCKFVGADAAVGFLELHRGKGQSVYPGFHLRMESEVTDLIEENGRVVGVRAKSPQGASGSARGPDDRSGRPAFDRAQEGGAPGDRPGSADRRACGCVSRASPERSQSDSGPVQGRQDSGDA